MSLLLGLALSDHQEEHHSSVPSSIFKNELVFNGFFVPLMSANCQTQDSVETLSSCLLQSGDLFNGLCLCNGLLDSLLGKRLTANIG